MGRGLLLKTKNRALEAEIDHLGSFQALILRPKRKWPGRRPPKNNIGPRNPLKPRAEIGKLTLKSSKIHPGGPFQKPKSLKTRRSGPGQTLRWPQEKLKQRGDPYQQKFMPVLRVGGRDLGKYRLKWGSGVENQPILPEIPPKW